MTGSQDRRYMAEALQLARRGLYTAHPNPRVGCVIVRDSVVVGRAWHARAGQPHAEVLGLREAGEKARGATVYVNLEPCCHQGRTPPCTGSLIDAGVVRVVTAMPDPNPQVAGGGIQNLRAAGIDVEVGVLREQAELLNRGFIRRVLHARPWVTLKIAASLDGRTAMASGESKWITNEAARRDTHRLRAASAAIMTGIGTVLGDDPALTARVDNEVYRPLRVLVDSHFRIPETAKLIAGAGRAIVVTASDDFKSAYELDSDKVEVISLPGADGRVDLPAVMDHLGQREINELFVEAGAELNGALLREGLVDKLIVYLAPNIMGNAARGMFDIPQLRRLADRYEFDITDVRQLGNNIRLSLSPVAGAIEGG